MGKLGRWPPRNSFSGNICFEFSVFVLCSAGTQIDEILRERGDIIGVLADYGCFKLQHPSKNVLKQILLRITEFSNEPGMKHTVVYNV
jgi:hypothetical protein